jgi:hypothetical protein
MFATRFYGSLTIAIVALTIKVLALAKAYIIMGLAALGAWLAKLGVIGLVIAAIGFVLYKTGILTMLYEKIKEVGKAAFNSITESIMGAGGAMEDLMGQMQQMQKLLMGSTGGLSGKLGMVGAAAAGGGVGGISIGATIAAIEDGVASGVVTGLDMSGFDESSFKPPEFDPAGDFDESLLEEKPKARGGGDVRPFGALELGTSEEFKARVMGQAQLVKATDKMLLEQKKTNQNTAMAAGELAAIRKRLEDTPTIEFEEAAFV